MKKVRINYKKNKVILCDLIKSGSICLNQDNFKIKASKFEIYLLQQQVKFYLLSINSSNNKSNMGQNQLPIFQQGQPLTNYDVVQKVPEHNISYLKHKTTNKQYLIRQFAINDKTEFAQTCEKIKNRKKMQSQYLTKLQRHSQQMEDNLCSSFYKIFAMWQYPTHTLADQINERALQKRRFHENQIFSIIASIFQGMSCLQASGIKHECLTTNLILFDETGTVKVADPLTSIYSSNFDRINTNRKVKNIYISPQQCESLKNQRPIPNRNPYKSDVFILGIILLECGLLEKMDNIFVEDFEEIDLQELSEKLTAFGMIYSKDLKLTVETMLTRDPKQRMDWIGLKQYVPQKNDSEANRIYSGETNYNQRHEILHSNLQPVNQLTLGGKVEPSPINSNRQFAFNPLPQYQPQVQHSYSPIFTQPNPSFNQTFGQPIQSIGYQPVPSYTGNLPLVSSNNFPIATSNYNVPSMTSNLYANPKVSNYVFDSKPNFERPTEQFSNVNNISRFTPGIVPFIDRESSSFPLNSQVEFKRDYVNSSSYGVEYQPLSQYQGSKYPATSTSYNIQSISGYVPSLSGQGTARYESHISKPIYQSKTEMNSQAQGSPFMPNYVKDAKSITYDKNVYSSYIAEEKSYAHGQQSSYTPQQPHFSTVVTTNQEFSPHSNNYYQPIPKVTNPPENTSSHPLSSNPVLYQPLAGANSTVKQKPNLNSISTYAQHETQKHQIVHTHTENIHTNSPDYQYKQINQTHSTSPTVPPVNSQSINPPSSDQQQLEYVIEHFKQGSRYEGTKFQEMRHGQGKFFYQDGGMYEGNWKFNKMDGFGKLYYQSGRIAYEGNWSQDQFQGFGKLYNQEPDQLQQMFDYQNFDLIDEYWVYYEGNFVADQKDGEGKMVFSNGEYFVGSFHKDMVDGPGEFYRMNGEVINGLWSQNQMVEQQQ